MQIFRLKQASITNIQKKKSRRMTITIEIEVFFLFIFISLFYISAEHFLNINFFFLKFQGRYYVREMKWCNKTNVYTQRLVFLCTQCLSTVCLLTSMRVYERSLFLLLHIHSCVSLTYSIYFMYAYIYIYMYSKMSIRKPKLSHFDYCHMFTSSHILEHLVNMDVNFFFLKK